MRAVATTIDDVIDQLGDVVANRYPGRLVRYPVGAILWLGLVRIRSRESSDVPRIIAVLDETSTAGV